LQKDLQEIGLTKQLVLLLNCLLAILVAFIHHGEYGRVSLWSDKAFFGTRTFNNLSIKYILEL